MSIQYWSYLLTAVGLTGFVLAGRKVWWCWYVNLACQVLWFIYAMVSEQYGFIVGSIVYTLVFSNNAIQWTREHRSTKFKKGSLDLYCTSVEPTERWTYQHGRRPHKCFIDREKHLHYVKDGTPLVKHWCRCSEQWYAEETYASYS